MRGTTAERRSFIRVPFKSEVRVETGGTLIRADGALDISMNGIRVPYAGPVRERARCQVTIVLQPPPVEVTIRAAGRIIRSEAGSLAVELTELDPDSYNHLRRLILNNAREPDQAEQEFESHWGIRRQQ